MLFSFPITGHVKNKMSVLFLYPHKLYKKLLALSLYVGIKTNNIDILFFTWPVMGKTKKHRPIQCSGAFRLFRGVLVFRSVPVFQCSSVPVFQCSSVPVFQCPSVPGFSTCRLDPEPRSQRVIQNFALPR